jgi:hypothetical protein
MEQIGLMIKGRLFGITTNLYFLMDSNKGNPNSNPNPNNLTVRHAKSLEEATEAVRLAEEEALKIGQSSVTFVNYEMSQERVTALMNRLTGRAGQVKGPAAAEEVRRIMGNAMVAEEEALKIGQSSFTSVNYEMSQERVTALMNRLTGVAGKVNGSAAAEEVRRIMGNAMAEQFGDAGSDNEGNSSEEERGYNSRTGGNGGGRGGRGNGGSGRGGRGF